MDSLRVGAVINKSRLDNRLADLDIACGIDPQPCLGHHGGADAGIIRLDGHILADRRILADGDCSRRGDAGGLDHDLARRRVDVEVARRLHDGRINPHILRGVDVKLALGPDIAVCHRNRTCAHLRGVDRHVTLRGNL